MMYNMENSPDRYYKMMKNYQEAQLLFGAINLDIFSYLDTPATAKMVAEDIGHDEEKVEVLLLSLVSCGLVGRQNDYYANTPETKDFLSRRSEVFLGESLLFRAKMTSLDGLEQRLISTQSTTENVYDFSELARAAIPEIYAGRVQAFIATMSRLYPDSKRPLRILDLGGGTGILAIEFANHFPNSKATIFEIPLVAKIAMAIIKEHHAEKQVNVVCGDFNKDDLGDSYDLIIASGILNFVHGDLSTFIQKLSNGLNKGGNLLVIGQYVDHEYDAPSNMLGWLSGFLNGIPLPPSGSEIEQAMISAGLTPTDRMEGGMYQGQIYQKGSSDNLVSSSDVSNSFIELTEQISNSRTNILDFGSEDMTFYRGEIHMIKMVGDFPGIHSAELARRFGITRPVVHKTLQKLNERGFILKKDDDEDKKRYQLYLTEKGQTAYRFHEGYHEENDKALFDLLADMSGENLGAVKGFLDRAIELIQNHA